MEELYIKFKEFLCVNKRVNNLQTYTAFKQRCFDGRPIVKWIPRDQRPTCDNRLFIRGEGYLQFRDLTFEEFLKWYEADRKYLI